MNQESSVTIILDRLRSAHNTGNIFRIAEAVGAKEILCCGYTPAPPHPKLAKTAMGTDETVKSRVFPSAAEAIQTLRRETPGIRIVAAEPLEDSTTAWDFKFTSPIAFVFGNEALGISEEALALCDDTISLPMLGTKASVNVGNCAAVILYIAIYKLRRTQS